MQFIVGFHDFANIAPRKYRLVKYSYRKGQVVHYKLVGGNHGLAVNGSNVYPTEANQLIASFLRQ